MKNEIVVAPDLDGCGYPYVTAFTENLKRDHGIDLPPVEQYAFYRTIGWTGKEFVEEMIRQIGERDLYLSHPPIDGFVAGMRMLRRYGLYIRVQTARCFPGVEAEAVRQTHAWFDRWSIPFDEIVVSNVKEPAHYAFDDSPDQIEHYQNLGAHTVIVDQPWNQESEGLRAIDAYHASTLIVLDHIERNG